MVFDQEGAHAANPLKLPCGRCIGCRIERSRHWALRCVHEAQLHERNCFITLTYDEAHFPSDRGLHVEHWQKFARKLRKKIGPFRYYHCGEYGEENGRPHYHALIFGEDFRDDRQTWKKNKRGERTYVSKKLETTWGQGYCVIGDLTYQSAAYCARYVMKKMTGPTADDHYRRIDEKTGETWTVKPEYSTMSRRPGIASEWYDKYKKEVYPADKVIHQAKTFRPPRYYDKKLDDQELEVIKSKRRAKVLKRLDDLTPERLETQERLLEHNLKNSLRRV